jgi:hypothetical protein
LVALDSFAIKLLAIFPQQMLKVVEDRCINETVDLFSALLRMSNPATDRSCTQCQDILGDRLNVFRRSPVRRKGRQSSRQALADTGIDLAIDVGDAWIPAGLRDDLGDQPTSVFRLVTRAKPLQPSPNGIKILRGYCVRQSFLLQPCFHVGLTDGRDDRFFAFEIPVHLPDRDARRDRDLRDTCLVEALFDKQSPGDLEQMAPTQTGPFA